MDEDVIYRVDVAIDTEFSVKVKKVNKMGLKTRFISVADGS